jgi:7-cyano-7-deazaguanine synthase in queuosine biosynthesis
MIAVLFSGGIDSLCCLRWAIDMFGKDAVQAVYFSHDCRYDMRQYHVAIKLAEQLEVKLWRISMYGLREDKQGHVPLRNLSFILELAREEACMGVVFGMLQGEAPEDKNPKFVRRVQELLDSQFVANAYQEKRHFTIYTPFQYMTKAEMVKWYIQKYGVEYIRDTVACFTQEGNCGQCMSCFNRYIALERNDIHEVYKVHPIEAMLVRLKEMKKDKGSKEWRSLGNLWARRKWLWEVYSVVSPYVRANYGKNVLRMLL